MSLFAGRSVPYWDQSPVWGVRHNLFVLPQTLIECILSGIYVDIDMAVYRCINVMGMVRVNVHKNRVNLSKAVSCKSFCGQRKGLVFLADSIKCPQGSSAHFVCPPTLGLCNLTGMLIETFGRANPMSET